LLGLYADLHVHSTASDGNLSPDEVVKAAASLGLGIIALTDHDTLAGVKTAQEVGHALGVEVIGGVELNTEWFGREVHVLGYFLQPGKGEIEKTLVELRVARLERAKRMVERLQGLGIAINWDDVRKQAGTGSVGRPHVALALKERGYVSSVQEAFFLYLNRGRPAYVPRRRLSPPEAIELIHRSGGVAVLAHPGVIADPFLIAELLKFHFRGVEVFHPDNDFRVAQAVLNEARERKLAITGGSDFHGPDQPTKRLGACVVRDYLVKDLRNRRGF
jgi:predicted metal-dependent phosphoesterase TrpH